MSMDAPFSPAFTLIFKPLTFILTCSASPDFTVVVVVVVEVLTGSALLTGVTVWVDNPPVNGASLL